MKDYTDSKEMPKVDEEFILEGVKLKCVKGSCFQCYCAPSKRILNCALAPNCLPEYRPDKNDVCFIKI